MDKNWLIRTKSNHILGPISKEKVLELYQNNSIKADDEICSGNGFWFYIREEEMVARYLKGHEVQGFNPISEAKDVLTHPVKAPMPEVETKSDDITLVGGLNLAMLKETPPETPKETPAPPAEAAAPQVVPKPAPASIQKETGPQEPQKKNNTVKKATAVKTPPKKPLKQQSYLKYLGIIGFLVLLLLVYFRKTIIRSLFQGEVTGISLIQEVHAQEDVPAKKKSF